MHDNHIDTDTARAKNASREEECKIIQKAIRNIEFNKRRATGNDSAYYLAAQVRTCHEEIARYRCALQIIKHTTANGQHAKDIADDALAIDRRTP